MEQLLGFDIDLWDYITFASLMIIGVGLVAVVLLLAGLPGKIAIARKHPDAEAVNIMGWAGFLAVVPWIQAFIWAFKPTDIVDIRRFPAEERKAIEEDIARLKGGKSDTPPAPATTTTTATAPVVPAPIAAEQPEQTVQTANKNDPDNGDKT